MASILSTLTRPFRPSPDHNQIPVEKSDSKSFAVGYLPGVSTSLRETVIGQPTDTDYDLLYRIYDINTDVSGSIDQWIGVTTGNDWAISFEDAEYEPSDDDKELIRKVEAWLRNPNPDKRLKFDELIEETIIDLAVCGDAFWEVIRDKKGIPVEVSNIHPSTIRVVSDEHGVIYGYVQLLNGKVVARFEPKDIMHFRLPSRRSDLYGQSPLERALEEITQDIKAMVANKSLLDNGFNPGAILLLNPEADNEENAKKIKTMISQAHAGTNRWHRLMVGLGIKDIKPWGNTLKDMQFTALRALATTKIATAFGVPKLFLNQKESGSDAQSNVLERQLYKNKGKKLQKLLNGIITEDLVQSFDQRLVFKLNPPDFSDTDALRHDAIDLHKSNPDAITANELRTEYFGLDEIDDAEPDDAEPDDKPIEETPAETLDDEGQKSPAVDPEDVKEDEAKKSVTKAVQRDDYEAEEDYLNALWLERESTFDALSSSAIPAIASYFAVMGQSLSTALDTPITDADVETLVDDTIGGYDEILTSVLSAVIGAAILAGSESSQRQLGYSLSAADGAAIIERYSTGVLPQTTAGINTTTKAKLIDTLNEGIKAGDDIARLKLRAEQIFQEGQEYRARLIAETEVVRAFEYGNYESVRVSTLDLVDLQRVWLSQRDGRVCPFCLAMDYQAVSFGEEFIFPNTSVEVTPPPTHPSCRCSTYFRRVSEYRSEVGQ